MIPRTCTRAVSSTAKVDVQIDISTQGPKEPRRMDTCDWRRVACHPGACILAPPEEH